MKFSDEQIKQLSKLLDEKLEENLSPIHKDIRYLKSEARYLHETANLLIESFEEGDRRIVNRVDNLERIAGITSA